MRQGTKWKLWIHEKWMNNVKQQYNTTSEYDEIITLDEKQYYRETLTSSPLVVVRSGDLYGIADYWLNEITPLCYHKVIFSGQCDQESGRQFSVERDGKEELIRIGYYQSKYVLIDDTIKE